MAYSSLEACLLDLERTNQLIRVKEEVDPHLEMASIQLRLYEMQGPAVLFERVKGSQFRAATNIFGTMDRCRFIFRDTLAQVQKVIALKGNPALALKKPFSNISTGFAALNALPRKARGAKPVMAQQISISDLPLIKHWPMDGGAFVTLPQVYSESPIRPGIMNSNLGMYRVQLNGNDYVTDKEIGLHYQIHRGIGVHQWEAKDKPLKVSIFVGGPPAHTLSAVMPLPEGLSEMMFAGLLGGRCFRYAYDEWGNCISTDADFVITGELHPNEVKPEGPFGDHLGYYSLTHNFPVMKVQRVYARKDAIWPFTVVGRPPQEDTTFGELIHEITGDAIPKEIPGVKEVHAVDAAGVHPLLLAVGAERYTPYADAKRPAELLTLANRILGTGQLSLAKYLFIAADKNNALHTHDIAAFFTYVLERIDPTRDIHFYTNTTIDTLDYSGTGFNTGSKVVFAAYGEVKRTLAKEIPESLQQLTGFKNPHIALPGIITLESQYAFSTHGNAQKEIEALNQQLHYRTDLQGAPIIVLCDNSSFTAATLNNFLWITFTRSNPSHDIYGIGETMQYKHWGCTGPIVIDARTKPHHAPALVLDPDVERRVDALFAKGGSLGGIK